MQIDRKLEAFLTRKIELERLKVEAETLRTWREKVELSIIKSNDYRSLDTNIKKVLEVMKTRLQSLQSAIEDLG